jgi:hypothetical protein
MSPENPALPRKKRLCSLLRQVAACFIEQTSGTTAAELRESTELRNDSDSLVTLYETGHIDPVQALRNVSVEVEMRSRSPREEEAPLTGLAQ